MFRHSEGQDDFVESLFACFSAVRAAGAVGAEAALRAREVLLALLFLDMAIKRIRDDNMRERSPAKERP